MDVATETHRERQHKLVALGKRAGDGDAEAKETIDKLCSSDDSYDRANAVATVYGSGDTEALAALLQDESRVVKRRALKLVSRIMSDAEVSQVLQHTYHPAAFSALLVSLLKNKRRQLIDHFFTNAIENLDDIAAHVLDSIAFTSRTWLDENFTTVIGERISGAAWLKLARFHASWLIEHLQRLLQTMTPKQLGWKRLGTLYELADRQAQTTIGLVETIINADGHVYPRVLNRLLRKAPRETVSLLRRLDDSPAAKPKSPLGYWNGLDCSKILHTLDNDSIDYILREYAPTVKGSCKRWLMSLNDEQRAIAANAWASRSHHIRWGAFMFRELRFTEIEDTVRDELYRRWSIAMRGNKGRIDVSQLAHLPHDLMQREAERHLALTSLAGKPHDRCQYAQFLPLQQALEAVDDLLGHPEEHRRGLALAALMQVARHRPTEIDKVLSLVTYRKNEQDPLRRIMLEGIADLPMRCLRQADIARIDEVMSHAAEAADLSTATAIAAMRLANKMLRLAPARFAEQVATLLQTTPHAVDGFSLRYLPQPQRLYLIHALQPIVSHWSEVQQTELAKLAERFGQRLPEFCVLEDALVAMLRESKNQWFVEQVARILRRGAPTRFAAVADELISGDASLGQIAAFAEYASCYGQPRLPQILAGGAHGRFGEGKTWVPAFSRGHNTWTAAQQQQYANELHAVCRDQKRGTQLLRSAVEQLARLAFATSPILYLADDQRKAMREIATRALAHVDDPRAVDTLLTCLADDRSRWAVYALRRALAYESPTQRLDALKRAPMNKVTVAKEVLRLFGELGGPEGFDALIAADDGTLHRDVRIARLRALWDHLHRGPTLDALDAAADDPDWVVAEKVTMTPVDRADKQLRARLSRIYARHLQRQEFELRILALRRLGFANLPHKQSGLYAAVLDRVRQAEIDEEVDASVTAAVRLTATEEIDPLIEAIGTGDNLPRLARRIHALERSASWGGRGLGEMILEACAKRIASNRDLLPEYLSIIAKTRSAKFLAAVLTDVGDKGWLGVDEYQCATAAVKAFINRGKRTDLADEIEAKLAAHATWVVRRIGLATLEQAASAKNGWTKTRRARLEVYRSDDDARVSNAARRIVIASERVKPPRPIPRKLHKR